MDYERIAEAHGAKLDRADSGMWRVLTEEEILQQCFSVIAWRYASEAVTITPDCELNS
jgi:hypothetical protein